MLISVQKASEKYKIPDTNIYEMIEDGRIKNFGTEKRKQINLSEFLKQIFLVITIYNHKGGVGKTSSAREMIYYFANKGYKVLGIDTDPQSNLTDSLPGISYNKPSLNKFLEKFTIVETKMAILNEITQTISENIDIIPASQELTLRLNLQAEEIIAMKDFLFNFFNTRKYQIIIIDTPPNVSGLSKFGLLLAHWVFIPVIPDKFSHDGISFTLERMKEIIRFNENFIDRMGFFSKMKANESTIKKMYAEMLKESLFENYFNNYIPETRYIDEIHHLKGDLFKTYKKDEYIEKIIKFYEEVEAYIYNGDKK